MEPNHPLFALLRAALWDVPFSPEAAPDYAALRRDLRMHAIQNIPAEILAREDPDNSPLYLRSAAIGCTNWLNLMQVQQAVCLTLEQAGIPCAILKGAAACVYYPQPNCRNMGDVDIFLPVDARDAAVEALLTLGCTLTDDRNPRHTELRKDHIHIELHWHFAVLSEESRVRQLDGMLLSALSRCEKKTIDDFFFFKLPEKENGLVLLEHINSHLAGGLGLRQIIDWMLYVHHSLDDQAWEDGAEAMYSSLGLRRLAVTVTRMCQLYLGLREDITWCQEADPDLCHRLMEYIFNQGNFGRKQDKQIHNTVGVLDDLDRDLNFFQLLHRRGCYNWKAVQKYPWLKAFAWLYQLCQYIRKALTWKHFIPEFFIARKLQKENADLLAELELPRTNHEIHYE